jgi:hypothetical protein
MPPKTAARLFVIAARRKPKPPGIADRVLGQFARCRRRHSYRILVGEEPIQEAFAVIGNTVEAVETRIRPWHSGRLSPVDRIQAIAAAEKLAPYCKSIVACSRADECLFKTDASFSHTLLNLRFDIPVQAKEVLRVEFYARQPLILLGDGASR